jgi:MFS family permease
VDSAFRGHSGTGGERLVTVRREDWLLTGDSANSRDLQQFCAANLSPRYRRPIAFKRQLLDIESSYEQICANRRTARRVITGELSGLYLQRETLLMRSMFRLPDFRLLFLGMSTSMIGDSLMLLVFAIWVKRLTDSNGAAGLVILFIAVPHALGPLGGWLVDRFRHRPFLVVVNLASALTLLPLLAVKDASDIWIIYTVAVLYGISSVSIVGALNGLLKEILPVEALATANGALQTVKEGLRLGGPLAGAALFAAFGGATVAAIDAVTFVVAAFATGRMGVREEPRQRAAARWWSEITAGLSHLMAEKALRRMMVATGVSFLVIGINESVYFAVVDQGLHRPPEFIGVLASAAGVGAIAGGLLVARLIGRIGELATTAVGLTACGAGAGLSMIPLLPPVLTGRAIAGLGLALVVVGFNTLVQRRTPDPLVGRVSVAAETITSGPQIISIAAGAVLVPIMNYRLLLVVVLTGMLAAAVYLWSGRRLTQQPVPSAEAWPGDDRSSAIPGMNGRPG